MHKTYEKPNAEMIEFETEAIMSDPGVGDTGDVSWGIGDAGDFKP